MILQLGPGESAGLLSVSALQKRPQKAPFGSLPNGLQQVGATGQPSIAEDELLPGGLGVESIQKQILIRFRLVKEAVFLHQGK